MVTKISMERTIGTDLVISKESFNVENARQVVNLASAKTILMDKNFIPQHRDTTLLVDPKGIPKERGLYYLDRNNCKFILIPNNNPGVPPAWHRQVLITRRAIQGAEKGSLLLRLEIPENKIQLELHSIEEKTFTAKVAWTVPRPKKLVTLLRTTKDQKVVLTYPSGGTKRDRGT